MILILLFLINSLQAVDVYFVRHGARSPLVVPIERVFGVGLQTLTKEGKIQSYYYGKQLRQRHIGLPESQLYVYSTNFSRTRTTAEYFLKGWYGIHKQGECAFKADPRFLPPSNLSFTPLKEFHHVDEKQYQDLVEDIPFIMDNLSRTYEKYQVSDPRGLFVLNERVRCATRLCDKFERLVPGSCIDQSINQFFNFVDIMNCLDYINLTVPKVTRSEMQLPLDILNYSYRLLFKGSSFPTKGVQQDFNLVQYFEKHKPGSVAVVFTHDTQMFYVLRTLIGIEGVFKMFKGNIAMNFLSCLHFKIQEGMARLFFNDIEFKIEACEGICTTKKLFEIMNT